MDRHQEILKQIACTAAQSAIERPCVVVAFRGPKVFVFVLGARRTRGGFTLIELLVVIAILAGLLLPALAKAKARGQQAKCLSNLHQLQLCWMMYPDDNNQQLVPNIKSAEPPTASWVLGKMNVATEATNLSLLQQGLLYPYHKSTDIYRCPSDPGLTPAVQRVRSYSMNTYMNGDDDGKTHAGLSGYAVNVKTGDILHPPPTLVFVFLDEHQISIDDGEFGFLPATDLWLNLPALWHNHGCDFSFADGHEEHLRWTDPRTLALNAIDSISTANNADLKRIQAALATLQ